MPSTKYLFPTFLNERCTPKAFHKWLERKAETHKKRDRERGHQTATREAYMISIHKAVVDSGGLDDYTGETLAWEKISTWDNAKSKEGGRAYKKSFWDLPTVDHCGDDLTANAFRICSWRTNDSKNDLTDDELIEFCRIILDHHENKSTLKSAAQEAQTPAARILVSSKSSHQTEVACQPLGVEVHG